MDVKIGNNPIVQMDVRIVDDKIIIPTHRNKVVKERFVNGFQDKVWRGGKPPNWNYDRMYYEAPLNCRNLWHINYFRAQSPNPYAPYKCDLEPFGLKPRFSKLKNKWFDPLEHQEIMASHWWTRKQCHIAAEMRTGKTLPILSVIERLGEMAWYIAPGSALAGVQLEQYNWDIKADIRYFTYSEFTSLMEKYSKDVDPPKIIVFDESHFLKNFESKRTKAAFHVTEEMRNVFDDPYIVAMTGTPSPKNPCDVWAQIEVVQPGFLPETSVKELESKLSIIEYKDNETGGQYPHRIAWRNSEHICYECGQPKEAHYGWEHDYVPGVNEVRRLGERLKGMSVKFLKRDCMNLPEKQYEMMELKPSRTILKYSAQIKKSGQPPAVILNELAQLSAGFYYEFVPDETRWVECPRCLGSKLVEDVNGDLTATCTACDGQGVVRPKVRVAKQVDCPKEQAMIELLEEAEPSARFVAFGGFLGCIDRMVEIAKHQGWEVIRIDGRGWEHKYASNPKALEAFSQPENYEEKICVVAHPSTGGTGVSYSASSTIMYWHNPFDGAARMQSIERGTDMGMDMTKGCRIVDLVQLPVDKFILENLEKKVDLQRISIEEL